MKRRVRAGERGLDDPAGPDTGSRVPRRELGGFQSPAAKTTAAQPRAKERGSLQSSEEERNRFSPRAPVGSTVWPSRHLDLGPDKLILGSRSQHRSSSHCSPRDLAVCDPGAAPRPEPQAPSCNTRLWGRTTPRQPSLAEPCSRSLLSKLHARGTTVWPPHASLRRGAASTPERGEPGGTHGGHCRRPQPGSAPGGGQPAFTTVCHPHPNPAGSQAGATPPRCPEALTQPAGNTNPPMITGGVRKATAGAHARRGRH